VGTGTTLGRRERERRQKERTEGKIYEAWELRQKRRKGPEEGGGEYCLSAENCRWVKMQAAKGRGMKMGKILEGGGHSSRK